MATAISGIYDSQFGTGRGPVPDAGYQPSANEEFMNPLQLEYFRQKLLNWKEAIIRESRDTMTQLKSGPMREPDLTDRASSETDWAIELRTRDRQRKLIAKIDAAIEALRIAAAQDQLQIARLKKRKLRLKDEISALEDMLIPDIIA